MPTLSCCLRKYFPLLEAIFFVTQSTIINENIVTSVKYIFVAIIDTNTSGEAETITTYSFTVKPNGYNEYYYKDEDSIYYAPLVVINDNEEGKANVYGFTPDRTFELVLEGTYVFDEDTNLYVFTTTSVHNKKVLTSPVDIKKYKSFIPIFSTEVAL